MQRATVQVATNINDNGQHHERIIITFLCRKCAVYSLLVPRYIFYGSVVQKMLHGAPVLLMNGLRKERRKFRLATCPKFRKN